MRYFDAVNKTIQVPEISLGVMRLPQRTQEEANELIARAMELGVNMFDTADIYAGGESDIVLGKAMKQHNREDMIIQTKASIVPGVEYNASEEYLLNSLDGSLKRLDTDYVDILLLHRPDALIEPAQVASAFEKMHAAGKVKYFGVSNFNTYQVELLNHYLPEHLKIKFNQMQLSLSHSRMIDTGINVNQSVNEALDLSAGTLEYSQLHDIRVQAWSPVQKSEGGGTFIGDPAYEKLNSKMDELAEKYKTNVSAITIAWILRHPAQIQAIVGTTNKSRLEDMVEATTFQLTHREWYDLYLASGKPLA